MFKLDVASPVRVWQVGVSFVHNGCVMTVTGVGGCCCSVRGQGPSILGVVCPFLR